jgi:hypothetical protein
MWHEDTREKGGRQKRALRVGINKCSVTVAMNESTHEVNYWRWEDGKKGVTCKHGTPFVPNKSNLPLTEQFSQAGPQVMHAINFQAIQLSFNDYPIVVFNSPTHTEGNPNLRVRNDGVGARRDK